MYIPRYSKGIWVPQKGIYLKFYASEVTFFFFFFFFFCQTVDTKRPAWDLCKMTSFILFFFFFFFCIPFPPAVQGGVVAINPHGIWQKGMIISHSLPHQLQTNSPSRVHLPGVTISIGHLPILFRQVTMAYRISINTQGDWQVKENGWLNRF